MTSFGNALFRFSLLAFPRDFRERYASEMIDVFARRSLERTDLSRVMESVDAFTTGLRMRFEHVERRQSAAIVTLAAAMLATTFALQDAEPAKPSGRIDFSAHDGAGFFTLTILDGKPVAATMNNVSLAADRIVADADTVKLLTNDGRTAVALAFDAQRGTISWNSREKGNQ